MSGSPASPPSRPPNRPCEAPHQPESRERGHVHSFQAVQVNRCVTMANILIATYDIAGFMRGLNLEHLFKKAIGLAVQQDTDLATLPEAALNRRIIRVLGGIVLEELVKAQDGENHMRTLQLLYLAGECCRVTGGDVPDSLLRAYVKLRETDIPPRERGFLTRLRDLLPPAIRDRDVKDRFTDVDIHTLDVEVARKLSTPRLVRVAREAREARLFEADILAQRVILEREPENLSALVRLACALEELGLLEKALEVRKKIDTLEGGQTDESLRRLLALKIKIKRRSV